MTMQVFQNDPRYSTQPAKDRRPVVVPAGFVVKKLPAGRALGAFRPNMGGMCGGATGGVPGRMVAAAFRNHA